MKYHKLYYLLLPVLMVTILSAQSVTNNGDTWMLTERESILLDLTTHDTLVYNDNIELSGKRVAAIIYYEIDSKKSLHVEKDIIFPQLRTYNKSNEPDWKKYRAYYRKKTADETNPSINLGDKTIVPSQVDSIEIDGMISFYYTPVEGLQITRRLFPSMDERLLLEEWTLTNLSEVTQSLRLSPINHSQSEQGYKGNYRFIIQSKAQSEVTLAPNDHYTFPVYYGALLNDERVAYFDNQKAKNGRLEYLKLCKENLVLETPDSILNQLFYFSKIRAAESIYHSSMGLVHSPGGGNYYTGIWANDQVEYSGPFFPFLGYDIANQAAYNTYKKFAENIPADDHHIAYAFEVDGQFAMTHLDRGDAAMISYGTALYLLNSGNIDQAKTLWPLIEWSLDYCHNQRNEYGAVSSESDEMEGRIETGSANLSTSSLYYGGLKYNAVIASALGKNNLAAKYQKQATAMESVIENYFGATIEGLETYRYFDGNKTLRHWICLPLTMGIDTRSDGTLQALFNKLWTANGVQVQYDPDNEEVAQRYWDRATLYALRGAMKIGENQLAISRLKEYSKKRLLGDHVPYAVEAYPENNMKHLSAESALYCRIFIEGMLGIEPIDFSTIKIAPTLPDTWDFLSLKQINFARQAHDITIQKVDEQLQILISKDKLTVLDKIISPGEQLIYKISN